MDSYKERIEYTARFKKESETEAIYRHLVVTEEELEGIDDIYDFCERLGVTFLSVSLEGELDFEHFTSVDNQESIDSKGLLILENDYIMDLGLGLYCIEEDDSTGRDSISDYFDNQDRDGSDHILKVTGSYSGKYTKCIFGDTHDGYIVLKEQTSIKDICTEDVTFEEEFGFYCF